MELGPVCGQASSSAAGGPAEIIDPPNVSVAAVSETTSLVCQNLKVDPEPKRYRIRCKTRDDHHQESHPEPIAPNPGSCTSLNEQISRPKVDTGKRTIVINSALGSLSKRIDKSHTLGHSRGIVWCWRCGHFAVSHPRELAIICPGGAGHYGRACLNRIRKGLTPRYDLHWPDGDGEISEAPPDLVIVSDPEVPIVLKNVYRPKNVLPAARGAGPGAGSRRGCR